MLKYEKVFGWQGMDANFLVEEVEIKAESRMGNLDNGLDLLIDNAFSPTLLRRSGFAKARRGDTTQGCEQ